MKLVYCLECGDIFFPGIDYPSRCRCGYSVAQWTEPKLGSLKVASRFSKDHLKVIGISNSWLKASVDLPSATDQEANLLHRHVAKSTSESAEGTLFKARECPIVMMGVPSGYDVSYCTELLKDVIWYGKFDQAKAAVELRMREEKILEFDRFVDDVPAPEWENNRPPAKAWRLKEEMDRALGDVDPS